MSTLNNSPILGLQCKAFCGPGGLSLAQLVIPQNEMTLLRSVTLNLTKATADVSIRGSEWRLSKGTLKEASIDSELLIVPGGRDVQLFMDSFLHGDSLTMFITDGFGEGLFGDFDVNTFNQSQPLEDVIVANCTVNPTLGAGGRVPAWVKTAVGLGPVITSESWFDGVAGSPATFQLTASPAADEWSAEGLPDGLTISPTTGEISGTPTAAGVSWPVVTAANDSGSSRKRLQIVIEE